MNNPANNLAQYFDELADLILSKSNDKTLFEALKQAGAGNFKNIISEIEECQKYRNIFEMQKNNKDLFQLIVENIPDFMRIIWLSYQKKFELETLSKDEKENLSLQKMSDISEYSENDF